MLCKPRYRRLASTRSYSRLSKIWIPTADSANGGTSDVEQDTSTRLMKAGFVRQTHAGIFHMLPFGQRVQAKLENLIDYHMTVIGASKVSLSTISSEHIWQKSGRLQGKNPELFHFLDRKGTKLLLSPTHEEEITSLVAEHVHSYKDLPLRLYQISRKYRDEQRPRHGLLRGREFLMKDLYTFDSNPEASRTTYDQVREAYDAIFRALRVPFVTGSADSGNMGGSVSHEYHFPSATGEDRIIHCGNCKQTMNEEIALRKLDARLMIQGKFANGGIRKWFAISRDRKTLVEVSVPAEYQNKTDTGSSSVNAFAVKAVLADIDLDTGVADPQALWREGPSSQQIRLVDARVASHSDTPGAGKVRTAQIGESLISLTTTQTGDSCQNCDAGTLEVFNAIEVGHTFNLGTRYSEPFDFKVRGKDNNLTLVEMGCHGIGVSRIIAAVASIMGDQDGLNWPSVIAPFSIVVIPLRGQDSAAAEVAQRLEADIERLQQQESLLHFPDVALDDRNKPIGWKLKDAGSIGFPIVVVVGKAYDKGHIEVQCRQLDYKTTDHDITQGLGDLLKKLGA